MTHSRQSIIPPPSPYTNGSHVGRSQSTTNKSMMRDRSRDLLTNNLHALCIAELDEKSIETPNPQKKLQTPLNNLVYCASALDAQVSPTTIVNTSNRGSLPSAIH